MAGPEIDREGMMAPMLDACPSFEPQWQAFLNDWGAELEMPLYVALGDLARHLTDLLGEGRTAEFNAVFDVVERWHIDGDVYVRKAATIGLLEGIQNIGSHMCPDPSGAFEPWLRPITRKWWFKLIAYWDGRGTLDE